MHRDRKHGTNFFLYPNECINNSQKYLLGSVVTSCWKKFVKINYFSECFDRRVPLSHAPMWRTMQERHLIVSGIPRKAPRHACIFYVYTVFFRIPIAWCEGEKIYWTATVTNDYATPFKNGQKAFVEERVDRFSKNILTNAEIGSCCAWEIGIAVQRYR